MPRWARCFIDLLGALDRQLALCGVDKFAVRQLFFHHIDFGHVLETARPHAGPQADDAAHDFGDALQHHQCAGDRDDRLELIDGRTVRRHIRVLVDAPGVGGIIGTGIDQRRNAGNEYVDRE